MTVASYGGRKFSSIREAQVVSLAALAEDVFHGHRQAGEPTHGLPLGALRVDLGRLLQRPLGIDVARNAPTRPSTAWMRSRYALVSSTDESAPASRFRKCSLAVCSKRDMRHDVRGATGSASALFYTPKEHWQSQWRPNRMTSRSFAEHGGHEITALVAMRGVGERFVARQACGDYVVAEDVRDFDGVGHRLDAVGIDFRQLIDVADDLGQFGPSSWPARLR